MRVGRQHRLLGGRAERRGMTHELGREVEPGIAEVEALAKRGHVVLVGGDVVEEGAEELGVIF